MTSLSVFPWRQAPPGTSLPFQSSWCWQRCRNCSKNCKFIPNTCRVTRVRTGTFNWHLAVHGCWEYSIHSGLSSWIRRCVELLIKQTVSTPSRILRGVIAIFDAAEVDESDSDATLSNELTSSSSSQRSQKLLSRFINPTLSKRVVNRINKIQMEFVNLTLVKRWSSSSCGRGSDEDDNENDDDDDNMMIMTGHSGRSYDTPMTTLDNAKRITYSKSTSDRSPPFFFYHNNLPSNFARQTDDNYDHDRVASRGPAWRRYKHLVPFGSHRNPFSSRRCEFVYPHTLNVFEHDLRYALDWPLDSNETSWVTRIAFRTQSRARCEKKCASTSAHRASFPSFLQETRIDPPWSDKRHPSVFLNEL